MNPSHSPTFVGPQPYRFVPNYPKCSGCGTEDRMMQLKWCDNCYSTKYCSPKCREKDHTQHAPQCHEKNYILTVKFRSPTSSAIASDVNTRTLSCPGFASFEDVHNALQIAFGLLPAGTGKLKKHYGFIVVYQYKDNPTMRKIDNDNHFAHMNAGNQLLCVMGTETTMHAGTYKMRMIEAENWCEMRTVKARAFQKLPWYRTTYSPNDIPSELRMVAQVMQDDRYRDCPLEYHYDFASGAIADITCIGKANPTNTIACLGGSGTGFDREAVNAKLSGLLVRGWKQTESAGYGVA